MPIDWSKAVRIDEPEPSPIARVSQTASTPPKTSYSAIESVAPTTRPRASSIRQMIAERGLKPLIPRSPVGEVVTGFKRSALVETPRMLGGAGQYISAPGEPIYERSQRFREEAEKRGQLPELTLRPGEQGAVTNAFAKAAEMSVPSLAAPLAAAGALALSPVELPAAAVVGGASLLAALPSALSQGQETYERVKESGGSEEEAVKAGRVNALIEGLGESAANIAGGKFVAGITKPAAKAVQEAIKETTASGVIKPFLKNLAKTAAVETGTEIGQAAGETAVEKAYGVPGASPFEAAKQVIGPTLALTAFLAPFGLGSQLKTSALQQKTAEDLTNPDAVPTERLVASSRVYNAINAVDPVAATNWRKNTLQAIRERVPISLDESFTESDPGIVGTVDPDGSQPVRLERPWEKPDAGPLTKAVGAGVISGSIPDPVLPIEQAVNAEAEELTPEEIEAVPAPIEGQAPAEPPVQIETQPAVEKQQRTKLFDYVTDLYNT